MSKPLRKAIHVFCSYARKDKAFREELDKHLDAFRRSGHMTVWHDQEIAPGTEWEQQINEHLNTADIILLLLSPDFIHSDYCYSREMQRAIERHDSGEARVIPIVLRHVHWQETPLSKLQVLPDGAQPITSWSDPDEAFWVVAREIGEVAKTLRAQKQRDYWVQEGQTQTEAGEYDKAEKAYGEALRIFPNHPDNRRIYSSRAVLLHQLARYQDALEMYQKAVDSDSADSYLYHKMGNVLVKLSHYEEALDSYDHALKHDPKNVRLLQSQGDILRNLSRYEEALASYNLALALDPTNITLYLNKGYVLRCLQRYAEALDTYRQALHQDPVNTSLAVLTGTTLCELEQYAPAVEAYDRALTLDPTSALAHYGRAFALAHLAEVPEKRHKVDQASAAAIMFGYSDLFHADLMYPSTKTESDQIERAEICGQCSYLNRAGNIFCDKCGAPFISNV